MGEDLSPSPSFLGHQKNNDFKEIGLTYVVALGRMNHTAVKVKLKRTFLATSDSRLQGFQSLKPQIKCV